MQLISPGLSLAAANAISFHPRFSEILQREEVHHLAYQQQMKRYIQFRNEVITNRKTT